MVVFKKNKKPTSRRWTRKRL